MTSKPFCTYGITDCDMLKKIGGHFRKQNECSSSKFVTKNLVDTKFLFIELLKENFCYRRCFDKKNFVPKLLVTECPSGHIKVSTQI